MTNAEKPPEPMMRNIEMLSMTHASLSICINNKDRYSLTSEESLERRIVKLDIEDLVLEVENYYKSTMLFSAFLISSSKYEKNEDLKKQIKNKYTEACSLILLTDSKKQVASTKAQFSSFFKNNQR